MSRVKGMQRAHGPSTTGRRNPRPSARSRNHQPSDAVPTLFHYTCSHFELAIRAVGAVVPHRHPFFPTLGHVAWFTTDPVVIDPDRAGLTSSTLDCDRTEFRFRVTESRDCMPWPEVRDLCVASRQPGFDVGTIKSLEMFGAPETWWVSRVAVPVVSA